MRYNVKMYVLAPDEAIGTIQCFCTLYGAPVLECIQEVQKIVKMHLFSVSRSILHQKKRYNVKMHVLAPDEAIGIIQCVCTLQCWNAFRRYK